MGVGGGRDKGPKKFRSFLKIHFSVHFFRMVVVVVE